MGIIPKYPIVEDRDILNSGNGEGGDSVRTCEHSSTYYAMPTKQ